MEESQKQRLRDYAWKYFALHAEQRMKTFHFYILLSSALVVGFINGIKDSKNYLLFSVLGLLLTLVSFLFKKLDQRNKELIRNGEQALKFLDEQEKLSDNNGEPSILKIFAHDDLKMKEKLDKFSYSSFLKYIFGGFEFLGIVFVIYCLIMFLINIYSSSHSNEILSKIFSFVTS